MVSASSKSPALCDTPEPESQPSVAELFRGQFHEVARGLGRLGVEPADIEDAAQEVFLVAHRRWEDFARRSSPRTWLWGIALKTARHYRRQRINRARRWLFFLHDQTANQRLERSPEQDYENAQAAKTLNGLVRQLALRQRLTEGRANHD